MKTARTALGFSLIELLVVVGISLLLVGGGIAAFSNYTDRHSVTSSVEQLKTAFQSAQAKANAGDLGGCTQLAGYRVQTYLVGNVTEISLQPACTTGTPQAAAITPLPSGIVVSPNLNALFQVLNAGVVLDENAGSEDIAVSNGERTYEFTLFREGRVSAGDWEE